MKIFIPSRGRVHQMKTLQELLRGCAGFEINLVVPRSESAFYKAAFDVPVIGLPDEYHIAETRQWIIENSSDRYVVMMDDDLKFFTRQSIQDHSLVKCTNDEIYNMVHWIYDMLEVEEYAHCSISTREQNFQDSSNVQKHNSFDLEVKRPYRIYAFDTEILKGEGLTFGTEAKINTMDDFEMTLNLMELGYMNVVSFMYAHNQMGSNTKGGASEYRDLQILKESAVALQAAHPKFVKLVNRKTISSWGGTKKNPVMRTDVNIQWKKAFMSRAGERKI